MNQTEFLKLLSKIECKIGPNGNIYCEIDTPKHEEIVTKTLKLSPILAVANLKAKEVKFLYNYDDFRDAYLELGLSKAVADTLEAAFDGTEGHNEAVRKKILKAIT